MPGTRKLGRTSDSLSLIHIYIIVEGDLRRNVALDIKRLVEIQSFLALFALAISQILLTSSC